MKKHKVIIIILAVLLALESVFIAYLLFRRPKKLAPIPMAVAPQVKGKIAIVLDDWGYNTRNLKFLDNLKYPLTFSVLPSLSYSSRMSKLLKRRGFQVILHLPMEPYEKLNLENNTISTDMDEQEIKKIIQQDLESVDSARGVSNHMGSKATEDSKTMNILFSELKKRGLYFLDSYVSGNSLARELSEEARVKFAQRDVFLDNNQNVGYIKQQIEQLKKKARQNGRAIGIGHDRKLTLEVLKETMPEITQQGYKFVYVSELVR
jgi:polysaccharide deacetylase 2 family uncharacterized protein YibQ